MFNRQFLLSANTDTQTVLHIFVDASVKSYGAVAYMTWVKSRVAPVKQLIPPQLELMTALVVEILASHLHETISTTNLTFWPDSQIVLHWSTTTKP